MDGTLNHRQARLLSKLKARTNRDGTPKPNFHQNVAMIKAELAEIERRMKYGSQPDDQE